MNKTVFIVGPTASGKSGLAMEEATDLGAEIVCADSQTVRRGMSIGTAKPSLEDQKKVPHHLLDIIEPYVEYSVAQFKADAGTVIKDIHNRGKRAIVVGGTGLYIDALLYGYEFSGVPADPELRRQLSGNPRHASAAQATPSALPPETVIIGLNPPRDELVARIAGRIEAIFENGFVKEVQGLVETYGPPPRPFDAIAYRYTYEYLLNLRTLPETKERILIAERQFAKRQMTWFKRNPHIQWFASPDAAYDFIQTKI